MILWLGMLATIAAGAVYLYLTRLRLRGTA
jgi:hypothetical protein